MASVFDPTSEGASTGAVTKSCLEEFKRCIQQLEGKDKTHFQTRLADLRLWADSVGATAQAKASLDWRFEHRPNDIYFIRGLLSMLEGFLKKCSIATNNKSDLRDIITNIDSIVDSLAFIGVQIRRSGRKSRLRKADDSFDQNRDKYRNLRAHLACVITSKPTEEGRPKDEGKEIHSVDYFANLKLPPIQERLVEANLRRRHRFMEAQRHSHGLKDPSTKASHTVIQQQFLAIPAVSTKQEVSPMQDEKIAAAVRQMQARATSSGEDAPTMVATSASGLDSTWGGLQNKGRPGSTVTRITAITAAARYPRAYTSSNPDQQLVKCPCCCQAIPATELEDSQWRKHVANDLCPYTCILENCPTPYNLFVTKEEWNNHVTNDHPPQWQCPCCEVDPPIFKSLSGITSHMMSKHLDVVSDDLEDLLSDTEIHVMGITKCPLCDSDGPQDSPELIDHVLQHVHDFSLRSLPWPMDPTISLDKPVGIFDMNHAVKIVKDDKGNEHIFHVAGWAETVASIFDLGRGIKIVNDPEGNELILDIAGWSDNTTLGGELSLQLCDIDRNPPKASEEESIPMTTPDRDYFSQNDYFKDESSDGRFLSQTSHSSQQTQNIDFVTENVSQSQYADDSPKLQDIESFPALSQPLENEDQSSTTAVQPSTEIKPFHHGGRTSTLTEEDFKHMSEGFMYQDSDIKEASRPQHRGIQHNRAGGMKDLEDAIRVARQEVEMTSADHADRAERLNNLGIQLGKRYSRTGAIGDLEEAIQVAQIAVEITPADHADRAERLNNLGIQLGKRYSRTGAIGDLEEAIQVIQKAVELTPADHSNIAAVLCNLGSSLRHKFERTGDLNDLNAAVSIGEEAVAATPHNHPDRAVILSNLGSSLRHKFERTGDLGDLNAAISIGEEAVAATPHNHPDRAVILSNLGSSLRHRFERTSNLNDLNAAISIGEEAVAATPRNHPDRPTILSNLESAKSKLD